MKKIIAALATGVLALGLLAGCGGSGTQAPQAGDSSTPAKPKDVTVQFWTISLKPTFDTYINGVIKAYQDKHPNVHVQWTDLPYGSMQDKLLSSIAAGESPDLVNLNTEMAMVLASKGGLAKMDDLVTADQKAVYFDKLYKSADYQGSVYALPWYAAGHVMIMNKAIVAKAGLDPNNPPKTWGDLAQWAKTIHDKTGVYALVPDGSMNRLFQDGVQILSPDKKKAAFNTPDGVAAVKWYADLFQSGTVSKDFLTKDFTSNLDLFMGGKMAFVLTGPQFLKRIKDQAPEVYKDTSVASYPVGKVAVDQVPLMNVVVPKMSQHQKEAADFGLFLTNDDNQLAFAKIVNILPSTQKAAADDFFKAKDNTVESLANQITVQQLAHGFDLALGVGPKQSDIGKAISDAFTNAALGKMTPDAAVADAEKKVNQILAQD